MSLLKIPLLFPAVVATHVSVTAPVPTPTKSELVKVSLYDSISSHLAPSMVKGMIWLPVFAEAAVILAIRCPSAISSNILSALVSHGSPDNLRVSPEFVVGALLSTVGSMLRIACYRELGRHFTFELSIRDDHKLVTSGPYSVVRHPSYTCVFISIVGLSVCYWSPGSWLRECGWVGRPLGKAIAGAWVSVMVFCTTFAATRTYKEDALLRQHFGKEWDEWAKRVPYRLIPGIF